MNSKKVGLILMFAIFGLVACGGSSRPGPKGVNKSSFLGFYTQMDSCQPTLRWKPRSDNVKSYELVVYNAIKNPDLPISGTLAYHKKDLTTSEHKIEKVLPSLRKFTWSVRTHYVDGTHSDWSKYDKSTLLGVHYYNIPFGFKTPDCSQGQNLDVWDYGQFKKSIPRKPKSDLDVKNLLGQGYGAVIMRVYYNKTNASQYDPKQIFSMTFQQRAEWFVKHAHTRDFARRSFGVMPVDGDRDILIESSKHNGGFVFVAPPGEYYITRENLYDSNERMMFKIKVTAGKVAYYGDMYQVSVKMKERKYNLFIKRWQQDTFNMNVWLEKHMPAIKPYVFTPKLQFTQPVTKKLEPIQEGEWMPVYGLELVSLQNQN